MPIVVDWKIKARSGVCAHTEVTFQDKQAFYTCIFDDPESDGFIRRDFSIEAWKEIQRDLDPVPFSFWKSVYKAPDATGEERAVNQNSAEAMLHRMIEEGQAHTENARYILALMLERKKILIPTETKEMDNNTLLFYEHKSTGAVYVVADPKLHLDELSSIQQEVSELLEAEQNRGQQPSNPDPKKSSEAEGNVQVKQQLGQQDSHETDQNSDQTTQPKD